MRFSLVLCLVLLVFSDLLVCCDKASAGVTITIQQVGPDVVATLSGTYDVSACSQEVAATSRPVRINSNDSLIRFGVGSGPSPSQKNDGHYFVTYQQFDCSFTSRPDDFAKMQIAGSLSQPYGASSGTGDGFGIVSNLDGDSDDFEAVYIAEGAPTSGSVSGSIVFDDVTLNDLAIGIGTSTFTWESNGTQSVTIHAIPEPSAFMFIGLVGLIVGGVRFTKRQRVVT